MAQQYHGEVGLDGAMFGGGERVLVPAAMNGHSGPIRLIVRTVEVALDAPYEGYKATLRLNPRRSVVDGLSSGETKRVTEAIYSLIQRWNFADEDGNAIPLTAEAVYDLPDDLLSALIRGYFAAFAEQTAVPKE